MRLIVRSSATTVKPHQAPAENNPSQPASTAGDQGLELLPDKSPRDLTIAHERPSSSRTWCWPRVAVIAELICAALLVSASTAHADTVVVALAGSVTDILSNIQTWIMGILAGLATLFLTIGAIRYVWGGGDPGEVAKAKTAFKSAGFGYCLALLAPLVLEILKGFMGAP